MKRRPCPFCGNKKTRILRGPNYEPNGIDCTCCNIYFFKKDVNVAHNLTEKKAIEAINKAWNG